MDALFMLLPSEDTDLNKQLVSINSISRVVPFFEGVKIYLHGVEKPVRLGNVSFDDFYAKLISELHPKEIIDFFKD